MLKLPWVTANLIDYTKNVRSNLYQLKIHLRLTMSLYIQIPNEGIHKLNSRRKLKDIAAYAYIRNETKIGNTASLTMEDLSKSLGCAVRSAWNYKKDLEEAGLLITIGKKHGADHKYNVYSFPNLTVDYSIILPGLLESPTLTSDQKGFLILLKTYCKAGTNHLDFINYESLAATLHMDDENLKELLKSLDGHIKFIGNTLVITNPYILYVKNDTTNNIIYKTIYEFCISKGVVPPEKNDFQKMNMSIINGKYANPDQFKEILEQRFPSLPPTVTLSYFAMGLNGIKYEKPKPSNLFIRI